MRGEPRLTSKQLQVVDAFQVQVGHADDFNLLDESLLEGVDGRQAVDEVRVRLVGRAVAQHEQRVQRADGLLRLVGLHVLRLVQDDDGPRLLHVLERQQLARQLLGGFKKLLLILLNEPKVMSRMLGWGLLAKSRMRPSCAPLYSMRFTGSLP